MSETSTDTAPSSRGTVLYEAYNLTRGAGTGVATYARALARAATRLGYDANGLFDVARNVAPGQGRLNEVLAFDAIDDSESMTSLNLVRRNLSYLFNGLRGLRPVELPRSGLVVGSPAESLALFRRAFAVTQLLDVSMMHFKIYGRRARLQLSSVPSIFHATHPIPLSVKGCPNIFTIHDLVPLRLPYTTLDNKKYLYRLLMTLARQADHIVTVSEYSKRDIIKHLGVDERRVTNTYQAVDIPASLMARDDDEIAEDLARHFGLEPGGYFLFYGAIEPKKNVGNLIDAYAASGSNLPLILAGGGGWSNRIEMRKIRDERFANFRIAGQVIRRERQVRRLEYLPRDQLVSLIRGARAVLFPSIYEGFGLPVAEAMTLGTPVLTSNVASLPEVAGDAAVLVNPHSIEDIARGIWAIEADSDLRTELILRGRQRAKIFSPSAYDAQLYQLYQRLG